MGQEQGTAAGGAGGAAAAAGGAATAGAAAPAPAAGYTLPPGYSLPPNAAAAAAGGGAAPAAAAPSATAAPAKPADAKVPPPFARMDSAATAQALAAAVDAAAECDTPLSPEAGKPPHKRGVSDGALRAALGGSPDSPALTGQLLRAVVTHDSPHIKTRRAQDAKLSIAQTRDVVEAHRFAEVKTKTSAATVLDSQVTFLADGTCMVEHMSPLTGQVVQKRWGQYSCAAGGKVTLKLTTLVKTGSGEKKDGTAILDEISAIVSQCDTAHPDLTVVARDDDDTPDPLHALAGVRYRRV